LFVFLFYTTTAYGIGKRFRGSMVGAGDRSGDFTSAEFEAKHPKIQYDDAIFGNDGYFPVDADPVNFQAFQMDQFNRMEAHLKRVTGRLAAMDGMYGSHDYDHMFVRPDAGSNVYSAPEESYPDPYSEIYMQLDRVAEEAEKNPMFIDSETDPDFIASQFMMNHHFIPGHPGWREINLKTARTVTETNRGRAESFYSYVMIGHPMGLLGVGFGESINLEESIAVARRSAFSNLRAYNVPTNGRPLTHLLKGKYNKALVIINTRKYKDAVGNPFLSVACKWLGLDGITIKVHGNRNPLSVFPAFMNALSHLRTEEQVVYGLGITPTEFKSNMKPYYTRAYGNRGVFGLN